MNNIPNVLSGSPITSTNSQILFEENIRGFLMKRLVTPEERSFLQDLVDKWDGNITELFFNMFHKGFDNLGVVNLSVDPFQDEVQKLFSAGKMYAYSGPMTKIYNNYNLVPGTLETSLPPSLINGLFERYGHQAPQVLDDLYLKLELVLRDIYFGLGFDSMVTTNSIFNVFLLHEGIWVREYRY